jgi:hypothetical protein
VRDEGGRADDDDDDDDDDEAEAELVTAGEPGGFSVGDFDGVTFPGEAAEGTR